MSFQYRFVVLVKFTRRNEGLEFMRALDVCDQISIPKHGRLIPDKKTKTCSIEFNANFDQFALQGYLKQKGFSLETKNEGIYPLSDPPFGPESQAAE